MSTFPSPIKRILFRTVAAFWLALAFCTSASAWWSGDWTLRKQLTLDTSAIEGGETLKNVPVLVRLHEGNFRFSSLKPDASDLRFVAEDDKTLLSFHIEKIDLVLNEAFVWVRLPEVKTGGKTSFWLYYGNAGPAVTKVEDSKATYDDSTVAVYHFSEHGAPATDSSGNGNGTLTAGGSLDGAMIGSGLRLDGRMGLEIPASSSLAQGDRSPFSWSAWVRFTATKSRQVLYSRRDGKNAFVIGFDSGAPFVEVTDSGAVKKSALPAPAAAGAWHRLDVVSTGDQILVYLDGVSYATLSAGIPALNTSAFLGSESLGSSSAFAGELDELVISRVAHSKAYISLMGGIQGGDGSGTILTIGEDTEDAGFLSALKGGYMGVIIDSLTVDGWVVIGILLVMSGISWVVMVTKGGYLNKIGKGNEAFLEQWSHVASDLSVLDSDNPDNTSSMGGRLDKATTRLMKNSPLYKVYHVGMEEIRHRVAADADGQGGGILKARSLHAIRATLDGTLTRETQKLNTGMVLLTIAISGGPFLGLLGTVVGVMITFAAVAQAGEVNVNAIAPGIAAALAATVAGLAVAIPALFGYNYLLTRIKQTTTDMHVFIDEFVTKLAEFYSDRGE